MNGWLMAAAALSLFTCGVHVFAGGPRVARPLLEADGLERVAKYTNYYCWHIVTIVLVAMPVGLALGALRDQSRELAWLMAALAAAFTVWSLGLVAWKHRRPFDLPQWALFLPITVLAVVGLLRP